MHARIRQYVTPIVVGLLATFVSACQGSRIGSSTEAAKYNYVLGTQTFGAKYQFTDKPRLIETAEAIQELGSNLVKFRIDPYYKDDNYSGPDPVQCESIVEVAKRDQAIRHVLEMPFTYYMMWVSPLHSADWRDDDGYTADDAKWEYQEVYNLTRHLLETYSGTSKTFYLGNWEGDWLLLGNYDRTKSPEQKHVDAMIRWLNNRQKAVDDAKRDAEYSGVDVFHYLEVVLVEKGIRGLPCATTEVLPHTSVDYVSYSAYEMQEDQHLPEAMTRTLDFIESQLKPKPHLEGRRAFIGEFGFQGNTVGAEVQRRRTVEFIQAALDWGSPFILQWQIYGNETSADKGHRGYWLIDDKGKRWPVYDLFSDYYSAMSDFVAEYSKQYGSAPADALFREYATGYLGNPRPDFVAPANSAIHSFKHGRKDGWRLAGDVATVAKENAYEGEYHLLLATDGSNHPWSAASLDKAAKAGETWQASVFGKRLSGPLVRFKLAFYDADSKLLQEHSRTTANSDYTSLYIQATAPEGTAEVHLVCGVEDGTKEDPVVGYFDNAALIQVAE